MGLIVWLAKDDCYQIVAVRFGRALLGVADVRQCGTYVPVTGTSVTVCVLSA